jgi:predicted enzyme related to lactoylglutathione lyase
MGRVVHFEIHADDPARAKQFYEDVFGWKIEKMGEQEYWSVTTNPDGKDADKTDDKRNWGSIDGGLVPRKGASPAHDNPVSAFVCTIQVDDLNASSQKVVKHAGNIVVEKYAIAGLGWMCYCKDTEGNIFGLMQADDKAS